MGLFEKLRENRAAREQRERQVQQQLFREKYNLKEVDEEPGRDYNSDYTTGGVLQDLC